MGSCFHCGDTCPDDTIKIGEKIFCCHGCKTVYEILKESDLGYYYDLEETPGISPGQVEDKFDYLSNPEIADKLVDFNDGETVVVSFSIPSIHCSSCIWILENLHKINPAIKSSIVNFPKKTTRITFSTTSSEQDKKTSLKEVVILLSRIGYEPHISLENTDKKQKKENHALLIKVAVAGFAFGNIMFLSLPEYFQDTEFWLDKFKPLFRWMMFGFSLPIVFYSGVGYFKSAYKGIRSGMLNIDVPLALGIAVLFIRSTIDVIFDFGTGYFDSLAGLVFFLLLGKFFQQKTYSYLSFERDYKSYFPIAITRIFSDSQGELREEQIEVKDVNKGDRVLVKNNEILPVDGILLKGKALIDYSFVTGEEEPVAKQSGDKLFAGGRQQAGIIEVEVTKPMAQSYLTQLWSQDMFDENKRAGRFKSFTDKISRYFTYGILSIAFLSALIWFFVDGSKVFFVFTAVLIVACPCALALAAPFTLGNALRLLGRHKLYLKEAAVIEKMAHVDTVVFDKTGTLTSPKKTIVTYEGIALNPEERQLLAGTLRASNHPLSRSLYRLLNSKGIRFLEEFEEEVGGGIEGVYQNQRIRVGSYHYVNESKAMVDPDTFSRETETAVHIKINETYKGCYIFETEYRQGIKVLFEAIKSQKKDLVVISGDNEGEKAFLSRLLPKRTTLLFNQKPQDKLNYIKQLQAEGKTVMMIGDGLNDAGALKQSEVGLVIAEDTNVFTPASDGILEATSFSQIPEYLDFSKKSLQIIKWAFLLSLLYNIIGLGFAVTGHLRPVVAAILMPLSSISIVAFTTFMTQLKGRRLDP